VARSRSGGPLSLLPTTAWPARRTRHGRRSRCPHRAHKRPGRRRGIRRRRASERFACDRVRRAVHRRRRQVRRIRLALGSAQRPSCQRPRSGLSKHPLSHVRTSSSPIAPPPPLALWSELAARPRAERPLRPLRPESASTVNERTRPSWGTTSRSVAPTRRVVRRQGLARWTLDPGRRGAEADDRRAGDPRIAGSAARRAAPRLALLSPAVVLAGLALGGALHLGGLSVQGDAAWEATGVGRCVRAMDDHRQRPAVASRGGRHRPAGAARPVLRAQRPR
jgi:hypothetical protein